MNICPVAASSAKVTGMETTTAAHQQWVGPHGHSEHLTPTIAACLDRAGVTSLAEPTLAVGETLATVRKESFDIAALAAHGFAFEALDQLAMDHLLGVR